MNEQFDSDQDYYDSIAEAPEEMDPEFLSLAATVPDESPVIVEACDRQLDSDTPYDSDCPERKAA